jgi:hypothetical protein
MKFAYADPPYFGCGKWHYGEHHTEAAVWDDTTAHLDLVTRLVDEYPDGWALSCNPRDLRMYLPAMPDDVRVCAWTKTWHQIQPTTVQYAWEPVILRNGRKDNKRSPMVRDWWSGCATKNKGLIGAKPEEFCRWIADLLNFQDGDTLDDLFPGTGVMGKVLKQGTFSFAAPDGEA